MKVVLTNSAVMPTYGLTYRPIQITADEFAAEVRRAVEMGVIESAVGYEATAEVVEKLTGWRPPLSRGKTTVESGTVMLVVKLRYRLPDPAAKRDPQAQEELDLKDFEFLLVDVI